MVSFEPKALDNPPTGSKYIDVAAGMAHILMLDEKGIVYGQGGNMRGQLGEGGQTKTDDIPTGMYEAYGNSVLKPKQFFFPEPISAIAAGKYHSIFLSSLIFRVFPQRKVKNVCRFRRGVHDKRPKNAPEGRLRK